VGVFSEHSVVHKNVCYPARRQVKVQLILQSTAKMKHSVMKKTFTYQCIRNFSFQSTSKQVTPKSILQTSRIMPRHRFTLTNNYLTLTASHKDQLPLLRASQCSVWLLATS